MIAWWGWTLIWAGLALGMVIMLALFAWWLFRKALVALDDLSHLASKASLFEVDHARLPPPQRAVLLSLREVLEREDTRKRHRTARTIARRESRMARAYRITALDASTANWPPAWTAGRVSSETGYHEQNRVRQKKRT
jgi:hypothetical protein